MSNNGIEDWKNEWEQLPIPTKEDLPIGVFRGKIHYIALNPILKLIANAIWDGTKCSVDGTCETRLSSLGAWLRKKRKRSVELGKVTLSDASTLDGKPCIRIEFADRFYEGRWRNSEELLDIVTHKDKNKFKDTGNISDVHILTYL